MPIYEYKCRECGELSEFRISTQSQTGNLTCKNCGSQALERKISAPVISSGRDVRSGQTCCGKDQRCSDAGSCCGH
jgi:putative FmdB family regulatory protein